MGTIRFGRRTWLRAGAGAAGALGVGVLAACGPTAANSGARTASSAAAPQRGPAPTVIRWAPWGGWPSYGGARWQQFIQPGIAYFESKNPGIKLELVSPGGGGSFLAAILAGSAPDVFQDWAIGPYRAANAVLNLEPYLRRDTPSLISLWGEYATVVEQVAPLVKGKGLQYFTDAAQHWGIANTIFKYSQQQVGGIINAQLLKVYNGQASVPLAMRAAGQQVDALESAAGRLNVQAAGLAKAFPVQGAKIAAVQPGL